MTRAVIKLNNDVRTAMPRLSRLIAGCAYNQEAHLLAFRFKNMTVNVDSNQINIDHIEDEKMVKPLMDWFVNLVNSTEKNERALKR